MSNQEIFNLFPTAILKINLENQGINQEELQAVTNLQKFSRNNQGNLTTESCDILNFSEFSRIKKIILEKIDYYFENIICSQNNIVPYITQSWINYTPPGGYHHRHHHSNSIISGVFYIRAVSEKDKIYFHKPINPQIELYPTKYNLYNSSTWWVDVKTNDIILFPSELQHSVEKNLENHTRISLSFNVFVRGTLGRSQDLNLLIH